MVGIENSVITPAVVILPILFAFSSSNHKFPSGPAVIPAGPGGPVGIENSVITPAVVIFPILFPPNSVNQRLPSGPAVIRVGKLAAVGTGYSVNVTPVD